MRVVFFIGEFSEGGAERVISILANNMIENGFDIEILKYYNSINLYTLNPKVKITSIEEHTNTKNVVKNLSWLKKHFKENADIIVSFLAPFNILSLLTNGRIPIIVADRNDPRFVPNNKLIRIVRDNLYKKANAIVVQTKHNKEYFNKSIQNKTEIIPNPIDIKDNKGLALKTKKENLIVNVARLMPQKNQSMLIDAFSEIHKDYPDYKLTIYGEGLYRNELEKKINSLDLEEYISLPGNEKDILNKIAKAKVFVSSSNYEGMSNSLIEAMCIGLPVITTKVSGTEDLIENNKNGIIINVDDKKALVKELKELLEDDNKQYLLGNEATKIVDKLDSNTISNRWIDLINSIMTKYGK